MLRSSYEFLEKLQEINLNSNQVMVSFDVKSLFTNVPLQETIDLISNTIYDKNSNANRLPIKKKIFKKLLNLATKGIFLYKGKLYQQIDGVSMGSPLGPTIANFFLAETETRLLQQQFNSAPKVYFRYVDDIFAIFNNEADSMEFLNRLNSQHKNLQFTMEKSTNTLPFLDMELKIHNNNLQSWIWRKPTHTGVFLNFKAICPLKWKSNLISCMLNRAKNICSDCHLFKNEVEKLRSMFCNNGYPNYFFDKVFYQFMNSRQTNLNQTQPTNKKENITVEIPYVGKQSHIFAKDISKLIWKFSAVHLTPIYKTCKVGNYFNLKSNTPALLLSNVVYRFSCPCDAGLTYIGKSTRHVISRAKEHLNLGSSVKSKIKDHIIECNLCNKKDMDSLIHRFSVIKKCSSDYDCKIHEALNN